MSERSVFSAWNPLSGGGAFAKCVFRELDSALRRTVYRVDRGGVLRFPPHLNSSARVLRLRGPYLYIQLRPHDVHAPLCIEVDICNRDEYVWTVELTSQIASPTALLPTRLLWPLHLSSSWSTLALDLRELLPLVSRGRDSAPGDYGWVCGMRLGGGATYRGLFLSATPALRLDGEGWPALLALPPSVLRSSTAPLTWVPAPPAVPPPPPSTGEQEVAEAPSTTTEETEDSAEGEDEGGAEMEVLSRSAGSASRPVTPEEARHRAAARSPYAQGEREHDNVGVSLARTRDLELANAAVGVRSMRASMAGTGGAASLPWARRAATAAALAGAADTVGEADIWGGPGEGESEWSPRAASQQQAWQEQSEEDEELEQQELEEEEEEEGGGRPHWASSSSSGAFLARLSALSSNLTAMRAEGVARQEAGPAALSVETSVGFGGSDGGAAGPCALAWMAGRYEPLSHSHTPPTLFYPLGHTAASMTVRAGGGEGAPPVSGPSPPPPIRTT